MLLMAKSSSLSYPILRGVLMGKRGESLYLTVMLLGQAG
jgi:hypothetical protein